MLHLRSLLAKLCPETAGLQRKHRIRYSPVGKTRQEKEEDLVNWIYDTFNLTKGIFTKKEVRIICSICWFDELSIEEVHDILMKEYYRNHM